VKWSKKLAIEHLQQLKNPFEAVGQNGQGNQSLLDKLKSMGRQWREGQGPGGVPPVVR